jgi:hypothetical protein
VTQLTDGGRRWRVADALTVLGRVAFRTGLDDRALSLLGSSTHVADTLGTPLRALERNSQAAAMEKPRDKVGPEKREKWFLGPLHERDAERDRNQSYQIGGLDCFAQERRSQMGRPGSDTSPASATPCWLTIQPCRRSACSALRRHQCSQDSSR